MSSLFRTLCIGLALLGTLAAAGPARPKPEEIARKVKELGSDEFAVREEASRFLWQAGQAAEAALKEAAKSKDLEVQRRAQDILNKFKWGIYPQTPKNIVDLINRYQGAADAAKPAVVGELLKLGTPGFVALLKIATAQDNAESRRELVQKVTDEVAQRVGQLLGQGELAQVEELLEICLNTEVDATLRNYAAFLLVCGRLDAKLAQLEKRTDPPPPAAFLAYLHRARGDLDSAREAAARSGDTALLQGILFEKNDWKSLARATTDAAAADTPEIQALGYRAVYQRLAGNNDDFARVVAQLRKASEKPDDDSELWYVAKVLLIAEQPQDALALLARYKNPLPAFEIQAAQLKHREAFALADKAKEGTSKEVAFTLELRRARALHQLGETAGARQLLAKLAADLKTTREASLAEMLLEAEQKLGLTELALEHCAEFLPRAKEEFSPRSLLAAAFPDKADTAMVWYSLLHKTSEPGAALNRLRELLTGKLAAPKVQELAAEAEKAMAALKPEERAGWFQAIGEVCESAHLDAAARAYFEKAVQASGAPAPGIRLGDYLAGQKLWKEAAQAYQSAWEKDRRQAVPLYLNGWALSQAGDAAEGRKLMEMAQLLPLGNQEERHKLAAALAQHDLADAARRQREIIVRTGEFDSWHVDDALRYLAYDRAIHKDFLRAADSYERYLLRCLHVNRSFVDNSAYLIVSHMIHRSRARGLMEQGKLDEANAEVQRCLALLPGDVELPILLVPELDKRGRKKEAEELFNRVAASLEKLCADYPRSSWGHNTLAWLCACCRRQLDKGLEHADKAVQLSPGNAGLMDTLAEVHFQRGDKAKAIALMKKCVELEPKSAYFRKQLQRLEAGDPKVDVPAATD